MANGYCPALLRQIADIAGGNAPGNKMRIAGFLAMLFCCQNSTVSPINDGNQSNGHRRTLTVAYRKRPTADDVSDTDSCDIDRIPAKNEWTLPAMNYKQTSWFLSDEEIRKYCDEASRLRSSGATGGGNPDGFPLIMQEHYELLLEHTNLLMSEINKDLVGEMATQFGENTTTGTITGKVININQDNKLLLENGIVEILRDIQENEICGEVCLVGGGMWSSLEIVARTAAAFANGRLDMDISRQIMPRYFFDKATQQLWGANTAGLFAPGSVKFLGFNKYAGSFRGGPKGLSYFTTVPMPVDEFGCNPDRCLRDLVFDLQMRYIDCPTSINVNGAPQTVNRGYQFILSKEYAMWVQPKDAYATGDPLADTNGTLKYFLTNTGSTAVAYAYP